MNSTRKPDPYKFKQILALVRDGDFAHAGEEEAIEIALKEIPKSPNHKSLDVGCGLGGTAEIIQREGYGQVTGIDLSFDNVQFAKRKYPDLNFIECDVVDIYEKVKETFDLIYLFNSFYSFPNQAKALTELRRATENAETNLVIFDYADLGNYEQNRPKTSDIPHPIKPDKINNIMDQTGWTIYQKKDLTENYETWYEKLLEKIAEKEKYITAFAGKDAFKHTHNVYNNILQSIKNKHLGGILILAKPQQCLQGC